MGLGVHRERADRDRRDRRRPLPRADVAQPGAARGSTWWAPALSIVGLGALVAAIIEAPSNGWTDPLILAGFAVAVVALAAFVLWERRIDEPMLDVRFFANARFSAASVNVTLVFFALFGFIFLATQYLQFVLGYSAFDAGVRTLPFAFALDGDGAAVVEDGAVVRDQARRRHRDAAVRRRASWSRRPSTVSSGYPRVMMAMILMGTGMGLSVAPATESIMGSLPLHQAGRGLGGQRHQP